VNRVTVMCHRCGATYNWRTWHDCPKLKEFAETDEGYHPRLKTQEEMASELEEAKEKVRVLSHLVPTEEDEAKTEFWMWQQGYNKGYEAGRNGERKRNVELIKKFIKEETPWMF